MEARALADALDAAEEQAVRIWSLTLPNGRAFVVFELVDAERIAGVIESADQRLVAPSTRGKISGRTLTLFAQLLDMPYSC